jgi:hypothetical protein
MKIFISWSGDRSEALAKALREWFPLVLHYLVPWLSQSDIQAGDRWSAQVAKELETTNFGVLCITRENLSSPWLLFEAGALAKSMQNGRVIPLLFGVDYGEVSGPLAQFQAKKADLSGIKELVTSLNKASEVSIPDAQLDRLFTALWGDLELQISGIPEGNSSAEQHRPQSVILEELVSSVRGMGIRIREAVNDVPTHKKRRRAKVVLPMLCEMISLTNDLNDPLQILIIASFFRDDAPWIYDLALEAYNAIISPQGKEARKAIRRFIEGLHVMQRIPIFEDLGIDPMMVKFAQSQCTRLFDVAISKDIFS